MGQKLSGYLIKCLPYRQVISLVLCTDLESGGDIRFPENGGGFLWNGVWSTLTRALSQWSSFLYADWVVVLLFPSFCCLNREGVCWSPETATPTPRHIIRPRALVFYTFLDLSFSASGSESDSLGMKR